MYPHIVPIGYPQLFFIGCKANAMTWISMSSYRSLVPSLHFYMRQLFTRFQIANFEPKQTIYSNKHYFFFSINGEWTNIVCKWSNLVNKRMCFRIGYI